MSSDRIDTAPTYSGRLSRYAQPCWLPSCCTGSSGFAWGPITSQLRRAAIATCLGPVVSAPSAMLELWVMRGMFEGWHDLSILEFPSYPPYFHLICRLHLICLFHLTHLASCRSHLPRPPASGQHLEFQAVRICHLVHLVHLIYAIWALLDP